VLPNRSAFAGGPERTFRAKTVQNEGGPKAFWAF